MLINNATFLFITILEDISFIVNPSSNYSVNKGSSFSLLCKVKSSQEVQYKWRLNDQDLKYDDNHNWDESTNQLLIHNARVSVFECTF